MSLLGFNAIARQAIAQVSQANNASITLTGVAGGGSAGVLNQSLVIDGITGVSGNGLAGSLAAKITYQIGGVAAVGAAGIITPSVSSLLTGVPGVGAAGAAGIFLADTLQGVAGNGQAGSVVVNSSTPAIPGVAAQGVAGSISMLLGPQLSGVFATGIAGKVTVTLSGGGSGKMRRDPRMRTGFEPVKKVYSAPEPLPAAPKIQPPPAHFLRPTTTPPAAKLPSPLIDQRLIPDVSVLLQQIVAAEAASRRQRQDQDDIEALLSFLDAQDKVP